MLIPITLPSSSFSSTNSSTNPKLPTALAKISHDETVLIELQGALEVESGHPEEQNGKLVGKLRLDNPNKPTLLIGHHLLEGKIASLAKPLAILARAGIQRGGTSHTTSGSEKSSTRLGNDRLTGRGRTDGDGDGDGVVEQEQGENQMDIDDDDVGTAGRNEANGPGGRRPPGVRNGSTTNSTTMTTAIGASSEEFGNGTPRGWVVVGIVKKKIVFSKRPMPVIEKK